MTNLEIISSHEARWGKRRLRCAVGKNGLTADKAEGDHKTPVGTFAIEQVYYRPDRLAKPDTLLPVAPLAPDMGWCDDPADPQYNKLVQLPYAASHERLWREDHVYDVVCVLDYNRHPVIPGKGSAIFFHLAQPDWRGTEGCVAARLEDMLYLLKHWQSDHSLLQVGN